MKTGLRASFGVEVPWGDASRHEQGDHGGPFMPFFSSIHLWTFAGAFLDEVGLRHAILPMVRYFWSFAGITVLSSALAMPYFRRCAGWKIILADTPGLLFIAYCVIMIAWVNLQE